MEDVLAVYTRQHDPDRPLVCVDETFGLTSLDAPIVAYLRWLLMFVLIILGLAVLYR